MLCNCIIRNAPKKVFSTISNDKNIILHLIIIVSLSIFAEFLNNVDSSAFLSYISTFNSQTQRTLTLNALNKFFNTGDSKRLQTVAKIL